MDRKAVMFFCAVLTFAVGAQEVPSLAQRFSGKFLFGFGGTNDKGIRSALGNPDAAVTRIIERHSNIIGLNGFYPSVVRRKDGSWKWEAPEQLLAFADRHPEWPRRAHVPFWPFNEGNNLEWLLRDSQGQVLDRPRALAILKEHYLTVMGRYKGRFQYWDVINEVVDPAQGDGLRKGLWKEVIGPELVEWAFRFAREADPGAKLFYNDYHEWKPAKRAAIVRLVTDLKAKGLIDGIGLQQHITLSDPTLKELDESLAVYSALGLEIHITELDVDMNPKGALTEFTPEMAALQAERYRGVFSVYEKYAGKITAVMTWNVTDADTWLSRRPNRPAAPNWPLLFDGQGKPKPAYYAVLGN
ncbi:MAG: endo-1,4-beta-xylanase [Treponemataceae bacterium]